MMVCRPRHTANNAGQAKTYLAANKDNLDRLLCPRELCLSYIKQTPRAAPDGDCVTRRLQRLSAETSERF